MSLFTALFTALSEKEFLTSYWQEKPYVFRQVYDHIIDMIDGNELAGLACEEEAESRIISGREQRGQWSCRQGPFNEEDFATLPAKDWTLLVQGVDQWIDEVRDILSDFTFIPRWRLEDIMASYAPLGGSVGPHFDYYDVFLIQVSGSREWHLGDMCDESSSLQNNNQVKLLQEFNTQETHIVNAGDMLYIPAGKAHWGIASTDDCITFSVGFRAPSEKEILTLAFDHLVDNLSDNNRYRDPRSADHHNHHPAKISSTSQEQLLTFIEQLTPQKLQDAVNQSFGELVTEPRYAVLTEEEYVPLADEELQSFIQSIISEKASLQLTVPPHSRLAFSQEHLFANGGAYCADEVFAQAVCDGSIPFTLLTPKNIKILAILLENEDVYISQ